MSAIDGTLQDPHSERSASTPTLPAYEPGDEIAGRYTVKEILGRGASGVVYRVIDQAISEEIAVKLIHASSTSADALSEELRLARRITHPNVCRVFDIVEHRHGTLLSMEYMGGGTLAQRTGGVTADDEVLRIADGILGGLRAAHEAGVVHRDLKPANVLCGTNGRVALSDFGVARNMSSVTETGDKGLSGTPAYMAPEQLTGEAVDGRTDLYALGLILYELLTGRLPFVPAGTSVTMPMTLRRLSSPLPPIEGSALWPALERLLRIDPAERPADVEQARALLGLTRAPARARSTGAFIWWLLPALAVVAAVVWWQARPQPHLPALARTIPEAEPITRKITSGDQTINAPPAFLPDGTGLVFSSNRSGSFQLWLFETESAIARPITNGAAAKTLPHVAGSYLYYLARAPASPGALMRVPLASLTQPHDEDSAERIINQVDYAKASESGALLWLRHSDADQSPRVWVQRAGAAEPISMSEQGLITSATFSPDGAHIAYVTRDDPRTESGSIWLVDVARGEERMLVGATPAWAGVTWFDNRDLVFLRGEADARALHTLNIETGIEHKVVSRLGSATLPAVGPDGKLAYVSDLVDTDVWVYDGDERLQPATALGDENAKSPSWVTTKNELAYLVERPGAGYEVRRVRADGFAQVTARRTITADHPYVAFSPSGTHVAYSERRADEGLLMLAEIDSDAAPIVLARGPHPESFLANEFALDGARVTYVHRGATAPWNVCDVALDGSEQRVLAENAGGGFRSRDGRWLAFGDSGNIDDGGALRIHALGPDHRPTGVSKLLAATAGFKIYRFGPGSSEITATDMNELFTLNFATGLRRRLAYLPRGLLEPDRMSIHPDGRVAMMLSVGNRPLILVENYQALHNAALARTSP